MWTSRCHTFFRGVLKVFPKFQAAYRKRKTWSCDTIYSVLNIKKPWLLSRRHTSGYAAESSDARDCGPQPVIDCAGQGTASFTSILTGSATKGSQATFGFALLCLNRRCVTGMPGKEAQKTCSRLLWFNTSPSPQGLIFVLIFKREEMFSRFYSLTPGMKLVFIVF